MGEVTRLAVGAMGTRFELVLGACPGPVDRWRSVGEAALDEILAWHARLNRFDQGSALSCLNRSAGRGPVGIDDELAECLACALELCERTGGAFDPTMGAAMRAAGCRETSGSELPAFGAQHVRLDRTSSTIELTTPGVEFDLGGYAKGWAVDRAVEVLRDLGVTSALLHGGTSTVEAIGATPSGEPWRVRLGDDVGEPGPTIGLIDQSLSLSRHDGREVGEGNGHVLDPRTGVSAGRELEAAAVVGDAAAVCDAWSTAVLVRGDGADAARARLDVHTKPTGQAWVSAHAQASETTDRGAACVTSS